jgi:hypothetical protein
MELFDHDPLTGVTEYFDHDESSGKSTIRTVQDCSGFLDEMRRRRNDADLTRKGIKNGWWHYASIPPVVILQLRAKGIDVYNKDHAKAVFREINENYPYLKTTDKKHAL